MKLLITAGPTREMLDPVRFLSNLSTGEMGYTLARAARAAGHRVTLISGPVHLKPPAGVRFIPIVSAQELQQACRREFSRHDALVMTAAVCDFTAATHSNQKIKRTKTKAMHLRQTPDIVAGLARGKGRRMVIGFCLETQNWLENAQSKLVRKHLDGIVANYYTKTHVPFGKRRLRSAFLDSCCVQKLPLLTKRQLSIRLLAWMRELQGN